MMGGESMAVSRKMRITGARANFGRPRLAGWVVAMRRRGGGRKLLHRLTRREVAEEEKVINFELVVVLDVLEKFPPPSCDDVPHLGNATPSPPRVTTSGRRIETRIAILGSLFFRISLSSPRHRGESSSRRVRLKRVKREVGDRLTAHTN